MASSSRGVDQRPKSERLTTILSIDGGGMRGLVPLAIIASLEKKLQEIETKDNVRKESDVRIADYFDVIAGTSTGGLIAAMLAVPDDMSKDVSERRPKYTAEDITKFYNDNGEKIFTRATRAAPRVPRLLVLLSNGLRLMGCRNDDLDDLIRANMEGPKYDKKELHGIIEKQMRYKTNIGGNEKDVDLTLADTLSNLVVPTFDVKRLGPVIFSSFPAERGDNKVEVKSSLTDVCMATAAAPTYFEPRQFKDFYDDGTKQQEYHLVDGGLAANNPTMAAIARVVRNAAPEKNESFDFKKCLVLSIGTGYARERDTYDVENCKKWSDFDWIRKGDHNPIIDMLGHANEFMVNLNVAVLFHNYGVPENYLRIHAVSGSIPGPQKPMDAATEKDMKDLYDIGNSLLDMPLARISMATWNYWYVDAKFTDEELDPSETAARTHIIGNKHEHVKKKYLRFKTSNDDELQNFAYKLCNERREREGLPLVQQGGEGRTKEVK